MCGITCAFAIGRHDVDYSLFSKLAIKSERRGSDASGVVLLGSKKHEYKLLSNKISALLKVVSPTVSPFIALAHSQLKTNCENSTQPFLWKNSIAAHNGIILNYSDLWDDIGCVNPNPDFDSTIIPAFILSKLDKSSDLDHAVKTFLNSVKGTCSAVVYLHDLGKLVLISNCNNLFYTTIDGQVFVASERSFLSDIFANQEILQVSGFQFFDANHRSSHNLNDLQPTFVSTSRDRSVHLPKLLKTSYEESLLRYPSTAKLRRCNKCILPETMPYISFNSEGTCNYCTNYKKKTVEPSLSALQQLLRPYITDPTARNCIVPFSGGRDSTYALHLIVNELNMRPVTYTYDWGMITDLGRRNISLMCSELGVENILVSADIRKKRMYISKNLQAWLLKPHLGMLSLLTAGDKHFFRYIEDIKKETNIRLNLWGINPLETTHFKSGFLGVKPSFMSSSVYNNGLASQLSYHSKRFGQYLSNPAYINRSLPDTLYGEYWRSVHVKKDYFAIFDFMPWKEDLVEGILDHYHWERAVDTNASWRIGDGTAAFYNYVYYYAAGFTEHDTFRSNQIREGHITREKALSLVSEENRPRYQNIRWYLDTLGFDFKSTIDIIHRMKRQYCHD